MAKPILYSGTKNASSWAMRAWLALRAAGYEFDEVVVDIRRPQRFGNLARIGAFSPPASVPVLDTGSTVIFDSIAIMEFANDFCEGGLLPVDAEARARARSLVAWQHAGLSGICGRISFESSFYPQKRRLTNAEQRECGRLFACYEDCLDQSGGPFLFGPVSLADFMHAPSAIRLSRHKADTRQWPRTAEWMRALIAQPLVAEWLNEADQQPHIWFDDYLVPGAEAELAAAQA
ncbi:glutathione S-transferase family protein [Ruegeria sp. HKCCD8929]|uniref:glutathione S-transferase family protein n=1 Tax=Ruegeria sp. HKCCD8929 TaxID=2683006 RepID=UPI001487E03E|nr:glutathione S-transferase [Ruegeria sp. HKCCD8929]